MNIDRTCNPLRVYYNAPQIFRTLVLVLVFNTLIAVFITLIGIDKSFVVSLVMAQSYGIPIFILISCFLWIFNPKGKMLPMIVLSIIGAFCGYFCGSLMGPFILHKFLSINIGHQRISIRDIVFILAFSGVATYLFYSIARFRISAELIQKERFNRLSSEKEALGARLRLLQAQIEPHFLFNTLSNILSLIDTNPAKSKAMLSDLIQYLRTSLSRTLPAVTTLGQEADMIRAYLDIQKVRMGERLNFTIDLPESLDQFAFPPMLLQPLVENAVEHGLGPGIEGGMISVKASRIDGAVRIEICDTGKGFSMIEQSGVAIANVKERIRLLYGDKGHLAIEENVPHGVRAIIEVPNHDL
jgi:sensor histidine kinase YesM